MCMGPRNWLQGMNSASLCSLAGRYENPIPPRCLAPINFLKIPALRPNPKKNMVYGTLCRSWLYNLTICPLQSRLQYIYHGQPYARVDFIPQLGTNSGSFGPVRQPYSYSVPSPNRFFTKQRARIKKKVSLPDLTKIIWLADPILQNPRFYDA